MFESKNLTKGPTYFESLNHPCIDNLYTNTKTLFFNYYTVEASTSDHHSLICTIPRSTFCKGPPKLIHCRSYNSYNKEEFETVLKREK